MMSTSNPSIHSDTLDVPHYLTMINSVYVKKKLNLSDTKRIIAPYVKARKKPKVVKKVNKHFSFYLERKPNIVMQVMTRWCIAEDILDVMYETAQSLKESINSTEVRIYLMDDSVDEIYLVTPSVMTKDHQISYKVETGTTVAAYVAFTKNIVKVDDLLEDIRFPQGLGNSEVTIKAVICVPVLSPENECLAVLELYRDCSNNTVYDDTDLYLLVVMSSWIGSTVYQNQQRILLEKRQYLTEYLLHLTECYFDDTSLLDKLITEIINFAKVALNAEHGIFFLLKPTNEEMFADCYEDVVNVNDDYLKMKNIQIDLSNDKDIVSTVAQKGININIKNAFNDLRVQKIKRSYKIRSVLCIPIKFVNEILGVIEIVNKKRGSCFIKSDEILLETFAEYCGFVLKYHRVNTAIIRTNASNSIYEEMLSSHMQPCIHDYTSICLEPESPGIPDKFNSFEFFLWEGQELYMVQLTMYMFNAISADMFQNQEMLSKFVLIVGKSYRDVPYHNFSHGFHVCHCMYNILRRSPNLFTKMEMKALMLASLCHDVDHFGQSNSYLVLCEHPLVNLYKVSLIQNHTFHVTSLIIKFLDLFPYMSAEEYKEFLHEVELCILATDLTTHFKTRGELNHILRNKIINLEDQNHRSLVKSIAMTTADLSYFCKPLMTGRRIIDNLYLEYYAEGDLIRELGLCPISLMNREDADLIAFDQLQLMTTIVIPCAMLLAKINPSCEVLYKQAVKVKVGWSDICELKEDKLWQLESSTPHMKTK